MILLILKKNYRLFAKIVVRCVKMMGFVRTVNVIVEKDILEKNVNNKK